MYKYLIGLNTWDSRELLCTDRTGTARKMKLRNGKFRQEQNSKLILLTAGWRNEWAIY